MSRNISDIKKYVMKKKLFIILVTVICIIAGICYNLTNVKYVSSQKLLIGKEDTNLIDTYQEFVNGSSLLEKVKQDLEFDISVSELSKMIETSKIDNTNMIEIKVYGEDSEKVNRIADEISKVFITTVDSIYGDTEIYKVDKASNYYTIGNTAVIAIILGVLGFVISTLFLIICFITDTKLKTSKDIEDVTGLKSLISIPNTKAIAKKELTLDNLMVHKSKAFKVLMTNIQFVNTNNLRSKSILITSPNELEGKTYVSLNLAVEFAKAGKKVIVIDADMTNGKIAKIFNLPTDFGFSNYLSNLDSNGNYINETITRFINDTEIKNLNVITAGTTPPNPAELLKDEKVNELIKDLKVFYDIIIFDTVSILNNQETKKLSKLCDLTLILSTYNKTKKEDLLVAYDKLNDSEGACIGVGLNKFPERKLREKKNVKLIIKTFFVNIIENLEKFGKFVGQTKVKFINKLKTKSKDVKEFIQTRKLRKEEIKLIEAAQNSENENIIEEVFESQNLQELTENSNDDVQLEIGESFEEEKTQQENEESVEEVEEVKLELEQEIQEQNKALEEIEKAKAIEKQIKEKEELIKKQKLEREQKEANKKIRNKKISNYRPIDLSKQPVITEEMVRRQVEMDELIRLAEKEEEAEKREKQRLRSDKIINFYKSIKLKVENIIYHENLSEEERVQKQREKLKRKVEIAKAKQEKKLNKELEKQKQKEQMRISIEIHDDNIYPRPRM